MPYTLLQPHLLKPRACPGGLAGIWEGSASPVTGPSRQHVCPATEGLKSRTPAEVIHLCISYNAWYGVWHVIGAQC